QRQIIGRQDGWTRYHYSGELNGKRGELVVQFSATSVWSVAFHLKRQPAIRRRRAVLLPPPVPSQTKAGLRSLSSHHPKDKRLVDWSSALGTSHCNSGFALRRSVFEILHAPGAVGGERKDGIIPGSTLVKRGTSAVMLE